ncbi:MAG: hypothetical protein V4726_07410 [Verrucomicrobiota bacterium]
MKSIPPATPFLRGKRGIAWLDVCAILTMLGIMAALAWMGWQRSQAAKIQKTDPPKAQPVSGS